MSVRRLALEQPASFEFSPQNLEWAKELIAKYPEGKERSAVIPLLWRAQEQNDGWTSEPAMRTVADMLGMAYIRVYEVATFYTMFQLSPVGKKAHVQVCGTTPCMLRGAKDLIAICKKRIAETPHTLSSDGDFSWEEVECLGACVNAPMIQIFKDTYEDLDEAALERLLDAFAQEKAQGQPPTPGPQIERDLSCPQGGLTSLIEVPDYVPLNLKFGAEPSAEVTAKKPEQQEPISKPEAPATSEKSSEKTELDSADETNTKPAPLTAVRETPVNDPTSQDEIANDVKSAAAAAVTEKIQSSPGKEPSDEAPKDEAPTDEDRPEFLEGPRGGKADDLKMIKGVGPKLEGTLNGLGIYHFDQITKWSANEIAWVDNSLSFKGRIEREDWISQAKQLAAGIETEFSKRASYDDNRKNDKPEGEV